MRHLLLPLLLACLVLAGNAFAQSAAPVKVTASHSTLTLIPGQDAVIPGRPFPLLLEISTQTDWHTYWKNPGDAGLPLTVDWVLPAGITAGDIQWPVPERIDTPPLASYGYTGYVALPVSLHAAKDLPINPVTIQANVSWMVCKDICIPQNAILSLSLPVAAMATTINKDIFDFAAQRLPSTSPLQATSTRNGQALTLTFPTFPVHDWAQARFFADAPNAIVHAGEQVFDRENQTLTVPLAKPDVQHRLTGLLRLENEEGDVTAFPLTVSAPAVIPNAPTLTPAIALGLAFLGGLILNLMPCVFPVLSLKILTMNRKMHGSRTEARHESLSYALGVWLSFLLLAGVMIALQTTGASLGWGFQMQQPQFVAVMALVLFAVGLNLSGTYEIPQLWRGATPQGHNRLASLGTGALAVLLATPCSVPFMAPAMGFALTQPATVTLAVFSALAFGMAFPFLLAGFYPRMLGFLPKPGKWLVTFRQVLAFPMYGAVLWLLWVLAQQTDSMGQLAVWLAGLLLAFAAWLLPKLAGWKRAIVIAALLASLGGLLTTVDGTQKPAEPAQGEEFSLTLLTNLRHQNLPVFVNVTAAWCLTCKANDALVLDTPEIRRLFKEHDVTLLTADWTRADPAITSYLASFGREGVPLYVYYPVGGEPIVLPQLLTVTFITDTLHK